MKRLLILFSLLVMLSCSGRERMRQSSEDITYRNAGNEWEDYHVAIVPEGEIQGLIVLLPGFGKPVEKFLYEISLTVLQHNMVS